MTEYAHFLPEDLQASGNLKLEVHYRGIYEVVLYKTNLQIRDLFTFPKFEELKTSRNKLHFEDTLISINISEMRSIKEKVTPSRMIAFFQTTGR